MGPGRISGRSQFVLPSARSWTGDQRNPCRLCTPVQFPRKSNRGLWALVPVLPAPCAARPERNDRQPPYRGYETGAGNYHARESQTARINIPEVNRGPGIRPPKNIYNSPVPDIRGIDIADCGRGWPKSTPSLFSLMTHKYISYI